jgi:hypothetical protein
MKFDNQDIKFSDKLKPIFKIISRSADTSQFQAKSREVYADPQLVYLWELSHPKDLPKEQYEFQPQGTWVYLREREVRRGFRLNGRPKPTLEIQPVINPKSTRSPLLSKRLET